VLESLTA